MSENEIIVCTTMRDFTGSENDLIQMEFLRYLKNQKDVKIILVVTLFGEKLVESIVKNHFDDAVFYNGIPGDYRYSLTQVINNGIDYKDKLNSTAPLMWTTCDVLYEQNFLKKCRLYLNEKSIVTSHPHKIIDIKNVNSRTRLSRLNSGFDVLLFSDEFINDQRFRYIHNEYVFKDWGVYEHFLIACAEVVHGTRLFNIFNDSIISKVENNRSVTNEPNLFLIESHKKNTTVFSEFLEENDLPLNYFNLTFCHLKFSLTKIRFQHTLRMLFDIIIYHCWGRAKISILKILPDYMKSFIKGLIR